VYLSVALFVYWYSALLIQFLWQQADPNWHVRLLELDWAIAPGAIMILILGMAYKPLSRILMSRFPQYLGRICYSIYLIHGTVLFTLLYTLGHKLPALAIFLIYVPSVLCASTLFHYTIEKPSMNFGRSINRRTSEPKVLATAET
jgi:peptidoglycan/LPS O-acetylase OafA/YrhL